jgi:hypothetical protein
MLKVVNKAAFILTTLVVIVLAAPADAAKGKCKVAKQLGDPDAIAKYCKKGGTGGAGTSSTQPGTGSAGPFPPPKGSFANSCQNISYDLKRGIVAATCRRPDGNGNGNSFDYSECPNYSVTNINGILVCGP